MPVVSSLESAKLKGDENKAKEAQSKLQTLNIDEKISQDATAILQRAGQNGYSIILPDELAQDIKFILLWLPCHAVCIIWGLSPMPNILSLL